MNQARRWIVGGVVAALGGSAAVVATSAHAASLRACNATVEVVAASASVDYGNVTIPAAKSGSLRLPSCQTGRGSVGPWVSTLQTSLRVCNGQTAVRTDGVFGPATERGVRAVQDRAGIDNDGIYGPNTRRAMKWLTDTGRCRPGTELNL